MQLEPNKTHDDIAMLGTSGYGRVEHDFYETPAWCTAVLLRHITFQKTIIEPAAGAGAIVRVLEKAGHRTKRYDIVDRGLEHCIIEDFITTSVTSPNMDIVTNPPYNLAEQFVRHALRITTGNQKIAMLLRNEWDCASSRTDLFMESPFRGKIVLTRRPKWFADSDGSPRHNYSWFIWDHAWYGPPEISYGQ